MEEVQTSPSPTESTGRDPQLDLEQREEQATDGIPSNSHEFPSQSVSECGFISELTPLKMLHFLALI